MRKISKKKSAIERQKKSPKDQVLIKTKALTPLTWPSIQNDVEDLLLTMTMTGIKDRTGTRVDQTWYLER